MHPRWVDLERAIEAIQENVSKLEKKIVALKLAANVLADAHDVPAPYPELRPKHEPMPWDRLVELKPAGPDEEICGHRLWTNDDLHAVCVRRKGHDGEHCGGNAPGNYGIIW